MQHLGIYFPDDPEYWNEQYVSAISSPEEWLKSADDLLGTLDVLLPQVLDTFRGLASPDSSRVPQLHAVRTYLMLAAFMFENLLKARILAHGHLSDHDFSQGLPRNLNTHNLLKLADMLQNHLTLTDEGRDLLVRLSEYAYWAGRYPAPTSVEGIKPVQFTSWASGISRTIRGTDPRNIELLAVELYRQAGRTLPVTRPTSLMPEKPQHWESVVLSGPVKPTPVGAAGA